MSEHFLFHNAAQEVVPWVARYNFPSQATRSQKTEVKIQPKGNQVYVQKNIMRIEFPASGYLDPIQSQLQFNLSLHKSNANNADWIPALNGSAHTLIKRLRVLYGSLVLEDIRDYNVLVSLITNHTVPSQGTGVESLAISGQSTLHNAPDKRLVPSSVQYAGYEELLCSPKDRIELCNGATSFQTQPGYVDASKYLTLCISLSSGLFSQKKLIPLKWMSSQLAIEIEWAPMEECIGIYYPLHADGWADRPWAPARSEADTLWGASKCTGYTISNVSYNATLLEFDSAYDAAFFSGLATGVPIKFQSWHTYNYSPGAATTANVQIQERSRSINLALWTFRRAIAELPGPPYTESSYRNNVQTYQWRIGGKMYPAQPVSCRGLTAAEAHVALRKALKILHDYDTLVNVSYHHYTVDNPSTSGSTANEAKFLAGTDLTTTTGAGESINGLNAEEQSDMNLQIFANPPLSSENTLACFIMYDALLVIRQNNQVDLVQ